MKALRLKSWKSEPVLGDAAHAMLPTLGQGVSSAVEAGVGHEELIHLTEASEDLPHIPEQEADRATVIA